MTQNTNPVANFSLPGLFEFYDFYERFLPLYYNHPEYFYNWCTISSIYGSPANCLWAGGRIENGTTNPKKVLELMEKYNISPRLTFSNSLLKKEHIFDKNCNNLCKLFHNTNIKTGIVIHSDLLLEYLQTNYPNFYYISSTTKVLTQFTELKTETENPNFSYVVPDFRLNKDFKNLETLTAQQKNKLEFLCNECCSINCHDRKACYQNVSQQNLEPDTPPHICHAPDSQYGYRFSAAMKTPAFISLSDIQTHYIPKGLTNFKIEGRTLGTALILEFILYYLTNPENHLQLREELYLDNSLDLF